MIRHLWAKVTRRPTPATIQATRNRWAAITLAEAIVKAEYDRIPAPIRALTEHRLTGDLCRGLER